MTETEAQVLPFLFMVLFGFIVVNLFITLSLYSFSKIKNLKVLCWYWVSLLLSFVLQGQFQYAEFPIMLSWSLNLLPMLIVSRIMCDSMELAFPLKKYSFIALTGLALAVVLKLMGQSFALSTLPMVLAFSYALIEPAYIALVSRRKTTTILQKFMSIINIVGSIHAINFALFRMVPDTQIVGFGTTLVIYQIFSIGMLAFSFEEYSRKEEARLKMLVAERTDELNRTLQVKDTLFKVVLHDIANPITGQQWLMQKHQGGHKLTEVELQKLFRLSTLVKDIIQQVRDINVAQSGEMHLDLQPVSIEQSLEDLRVIFEGQLEEKGIKLVVENELPPGTQFIADKNAFITSVLCNLVSNAIKFSPADTDLRIRSFLKDGQVVIEVVDQGIGMPREMALGLFDPSKKKSRVGTFGERGTGYGMPLVKSFVDYFGGKIEVESTPMEVDPIHHGTKVTVKLNQATIQ